MLLLMVWAISIPAIVVGAMLLVMGFRGRRTNEHPVCRGCRYDLEGVYPDHAVCPECGLALAGGVRHGVRRRRPRVVALGAVALLIGLVVAGVAVLGASSGFNWNTVKPTWLLLRETRSVTPATIDAAFAELSDRFEEDKLDAGGITILVERILALQSDREGPWKVEWGNLFDAIDAGGFVGEDAYERYTRNSVWPTFEIRSRVRVGDPVPYRVVFRNARLGEGTRINVGISIDSCSIGSVLLPEHHGFMIHGIEGSRFPSSLSSTTYLDTGDNDLPVGKQVVRLKFEMGIFERPSTREPVDRWPIEYTATMDVLPRDADDIELIDNPELTESLRSAIHIDECRVYANQGQVLATAHVTMTDLPVNCAFEMFWKAGDWTCSMGTFSGKAGTGGSTMGYHVYPNTFDGRLVDEVEVVLVPNPDTARNQTIDVQRIWGREIHYEHVPVEYEEGVLELLGDNDG
jgi:hypothetical protein